MCKIGSSDNKKVNLYTYQCLCFLRKLKSLQQQSRRSFFSHVFGHVDFLENYFENLVINMAKIGHSSDNEPITDRVLVELGF